MGLRLIFSTWETVGIAVGVAVGAALLSVGIAVLVMRRLRDRRGTPEERVSALVRELDLRMRQLGEDLSEELERTKEESRRSRYLGELAWTIELEEVMRRTLDAAAGLDGVDAALVTALDETGEPMTKGSGLSEEEVRQLELDQRTGSGRVQSLTISYAHAAGCRSRRPAARRHQPAGADRGAHAQDRRRQRLLARRHPALSRRRRTSALEDLAARAGPALDNARRYLEARRLADLDARTGLHNARYFEETLQREVVARAALQPPARARRLRPRRLQADQRPLQSSGRERRARRHRRPAPRGAALGRRRGALRRRRVRGRPPRGRASRRHSSSTSGCASTSPRVRSSPSAGSACRAGSANSRARRTGRRS